MSCDCESPDNLNIRTGICDIIVSDTVKNRGSMMQNLANDQDVNSNDGKDAVMRCDFGIVTFLPMAVKYKRKG